MVEKAVGATSLAPLLRRATRGAGIVALWGILPFAELRPRRASGSEESSRPIFNSRALSGLRCAIDGYATPRSLQRHTCFEIPGQL